MTGIRKIGLIDSPARLLTKATYWEKVLIYSNRWISHPHLEEEALQRTFSLRGSPAMVGTIAHKEQQVVLLTYFFFYFVAVRSCWCCSHIRLANAFCGQPLLIQNVCRITTPSCHNETGNAANRKCSGKGDKHRINIQPSSTSGVRVRTPDIPEIRIREKCIFLFFIGKRVSLVELLFFFFKYNFRSYLCLDCQMVVRCNIDMSQYRSRRYEV